MTETLIWQGCYDGNLKPYITKDSFVHPAKMARGLLERILAFGHENGYWQPEDLLIDPFGGIGTTGLIGAYHGYPVVMIELEETFVKLIQKNIDKNKNAWLWLKRPTPQVIQGDSRQLGTLLAQQGIGGSITSPPYAEIAMQGGTEGLKKYGTGLTGGERCFNEYGADPAQIGNQKTGDLEAVVGAIGSPPYANSLDRGNVAAEARRTEARKQGKSNAEHVSPIDMEKIGERTQDTGDSAGQIGQQPLGELEEVMGAITSPPFAGNSGGTGEASSGPMNERHPGVFERHLGSMNNEAGYGGAEGQINAQPMQADDLEEVKGAVTSSPYQNMQVAVNADSIDYEKQYEAYKKTGAGMSFERFVEYQKSLSVEVGDTEGQIANEAKDTYWHSVAQIYQQIFMLLPAGRPLVIVIKDFVKNGERVRLSDQTQDLLEALGFEVPYRIRAMLVKEQKQLSLFTGEEETVSKKERKSFFRRLAEKKGAPPIDWEDVIWAVKP